MFVWSGNAYSVDVNLPVVAFYRHVGAEVAVVATFRGDAVPEFGKAWAVAIAENPGLHGDAVLADLWLRLNCGDLAVPHVAAAPPTDEEPAQSPGP